MKTDISITVKRTEDSGYRGNMYLGFAALFCGVLSVLLFISGFNAIGYTGELVYLSAFLLSFIFCYGTPVCQNAITAAFSSLFH